MATSFNGWLDSWKGWGEANPNSMYGSVTVTFHAQGSLEGINVSQPENGPSGGSSWLVGYVPSFGRKPVTKRRNKRDELLFFTA